VRVEVVLGHALQAFAVELAGGIDWYLVEEDDLLGRLVADAFTRELDEVGGNDGDRVGIGVEPDAPEIAEVDAASERPSIGILPPLRPNRAPEVTAQWPPRGA